jgi:hypothetical protein
MPFAHVTGYRIAGSFRFGRICKENVNYGNAVKGAYLKLAYLNSKTYTLYILYSYVKMSIFYAYALVLGESTFFFPLSSINGS